MAPKGKPVRNQGIGANAQWIAIRGILALAAADANNIGLILRDQGDLAGALEYSQRALSISERFTALTIPPQNCMQLICAACRIDGRRVRRPDRECVTGVAVEFKPTHYLTAG